MYSARVPADAPHLADTWSSDGFVNGRPAFRSDAHGMRLRYETGIWCISQDFLPLAFAMSDAKHPNTVHPGEWNVLVHLPGGWRNEPRFCLAIPLSSAAQRAEGAVDLAVVGDDLFERVKPPPMWYIEPRTGTLAFSGVVTGGKRFCSTCAKSIASKSFSAHLRSAHGLAPPTRQLAFEQEG